MDRPVLAPDDPAAVPGAVAQAGVDPTLERRAPPRMPSAARSPPAAQVWLGYDRGSCSWTVDHASCKWVVTLHSSEEQIFLQSHARGSAGRVRGVADGAGNRDWITPRLAPQRLFSADVRP